MNMKYYLHCVLLALLMIVACSTLGGHSGPQIGDPVPSVTLTDFQGKSVKIPQDFKGKVVLVRFWSIDCSYCDKKMLDAFEVYYQKYKELGFVPVAINTSRIDVNDERLKKLAQLSYPMLLDEYGLVVKKFGVIGLPATFVFDEEGILRGKLTGEAGVEGFERLFTSVLYKGSFYYEGRF
ncbi:TlpA disulfide reductase family protein [Nitrosomonas communis]|uniref:TlpA family protein disulfide reductase n=1 Tax=Nitrosomonas communis TaxID=44574 RepID=UPI0026EA8548|nr:TlpA disulfide reductase family protein [Nitrosomonas communis]MCO6427078.1 TlpA family protein disulfide reductase [Nitrosomonas communis]